MIERAILDNMHQAVEKRDLDQLDRARDLLQHLQLQKTGSGFIDYSQAESPHVSEISQFNGTIRYRTDSNIVTFGDRVVHLSPSENSILDILSQHLNEPVSVEAIKRRLYEPGEIRSDSSVSKNIQRMRQKIEQDPKHPQYLLVRPGLGYILRATVFEPV